MTTKRTPEQTARLLEAIKFFETFDPEAEGGRLYMGDFGWHGDNTHEPNLCGTTACALGWLALKRIAGFEPRWFDLSGPEQHLEVAFGPYRYFRAASEAFGIDIELCDGRLFGGENEDATLKTVAKRLRKETGL